MSEQKIPLTNLLILDIEGHTTAIKFNPALSVYFIGVIEVTNEGNRIHRFSDIDSAVSFVNSRLQLDFTLVCHNAAFDYSVLKLHGLNHTISPDKLSVACTMVMEYTRASNLDSYSLDALTGMKTDVVQACVDKQLIEPMTHEQFWHIDWGNNDGVMNEIADYCISDLKATHVLYKRLAAWYNQPNHAGFVKRLITLEFAMLEVISNLERNGIHVDGHLLSQLSYDIQQQLDKEQAQMSAKVGLMPKLQWKTETYEPVVTTYVKGHFKSKNNISYYLHNGECVCSEPSFVYEHCKLVPYNANHATGHNWWLLKDTELITRADKTKKGKPALTKDYWEAVADDMPVDLPIAKIIKSQKALSMTQTLHQHRQVTGRVYCSFANTRTRTGRLATNSPNLQNIPRADKDSQSIASRFRQLFTAPENKCVLVADLDRIELCVLAWYLYKVMGDRSMLEVINAGTDIHQANADKWGISRTLAKTLVFLLVYGGGANLIVKRGLLPTLEEAEAAVEKVKAEQPQIFDMMKLVWAKTAKRGYVSNPFNARGVYPELNAANKWDRYRGQRQCFNYLIQATARDVLHTLLIQTLPIVNSYRAKLVNVIHDEAIVECDTEFADYLVSELNSIWNERMDILPGIRVSGEWNKGDSWYTAKGA